MDVIPYASARSDQPCGFYGSNPDLALFKVLADLDSPLDVCSEAKFEVWQNSNDI